MPSPTVLTQHGIGLDPPISLLPLIPQVPIPRSFPAEQLPRIPNVEVHASKI